MTYSIVARDAVTGHFGIAVASRFFAVGSMVPTIDSGIGAVASQAFANPLYGAKSLKLLSAGIRPSEVIDTVTGQDTGQAHRQIHLIDNQGRNAAFTGANCIDWAGHEMAENVSVAGNMLSGPEVVSRTLQTYQAELDQPLTERLLLAMQAGEDAGGDKRGKQAAGLLVYKDQDYPWLDLRVDDHADPLQELRRLYAVAQERYLVMLDMMATRDNPHGLTDRQQIDEKVKSLEEQRRIAGVPSRSHATSK